MKDIVIYKDNHLNGGIDFTNDSNIFTIENSIRYSCLFVCNQGSTKKRILNVSSINLDNIVLGVLEDESGVIVGEGFTEENISTYDNYSDMRSFNNLVLGVNEFFAVLLRLDNTENNISKRSINITVEYVDEY